MNIFTKLTVGSSVVAFMTIAQAAPPQDAQYLATKSPDDQLAEKVKAVLNQNADLRADELRVQVADGVAYIYGQVSTPLETRDVRETLSKDIVAHVPGITKVIVQTSSSGE